MTSSSETHTPGPDLVAGVPSDAVVDGAMLLGHVNEEPVLLARTGDSLYAIGATCTHYGGPLARGLLVGDTVRCPWHHACFSLRTGEALRAPALDAVPCYRVVENQGRIVVRERIHPDLLRVPKHSPKSIVIIGAGAAGVAAAEQCRRMGYAGPLHLIDEHDTLPVDRPNLSKEYLAGDASDDWVWLRPQDFYDDLEITLIRGARIARIDPNQKTVVTETGVTYPFGRLLLATGATPVQLDVPGHDLPHVHYLRSLADSRSIIQATASATTAVVIGASFIGLEVAASLRRRGLSVHVVAPEARPLERVLGSALGDMVRAEHESKGVVFHLERTVAQIADGHVVLSDQQSLPADLVVIGVGVRPNLELATALGLQVDKGIVVNEYLETSRSGIFAAGDIARWPDVRSGKSIRVEHWAVAERQGQVAARNMLGEHERFDLVPFFWSRHFELAVDYVGHAEQWSRTVVDGDVMRHDCAVSYYDGDRLCAVATVNRERESLASELAMERSV